MKKMFRLHPLFLVLGVFMASLGLLKEFLIYMFVVVLHEMAHEIVAVKLGYNLNKIYLLPFGAMLDLNQNFLSTEDEVKVAIAGPALNFILIFLSLALWWIFPSLYSVTELFVFCNFVTGLINLLPCYPMDGGRVFVSLLSKKIKRNKALKISYIFNYVFSLIFLILFFINLKTEVNLTYALMAIFIFMGTINNKFSGTYGLSILSSKKTLSEAAGIYVKSDTELFKIYKFLKPKKFNIIYIEFPNGQIKSITENTIKKYIEKYPINLTLEEIMN